MQLAKITSILTLAIFATINFALIRVKRRDPHPDGVTTFPIWLPACGVAASLMFLGIGVYELIG